MMTRLLGREVHRSIVFLAAFLLLQTGSGFSQGESLSLFHDVHRAMGSEFSIDIYAPDAKTAQQWIDLSFDEVDRIEDLLSNYRPSSELSRISREAGAHPITTDPETFAFLETCVDWSRRSFGAFDITVGPLMRAWGFFFDHGRIPTNSELARLKKQTGWSNIRLERASRTVYSTNRNSMELDPGGIGKGYAVDRIVAVLHQQNVKAALISAGTSTIYAMGAPPDGNGWLVTIPDPAKANTALTSLRLADLSLSTSGCTEKFFIKNGHRYCHILDPHTMRPVEGMLQTTVVAPSAADSDALSTATFVMGPSKAAQFLGTLSDTSAVFVAGTPESPSYSTVRWRGSLSVNKMTKQGKGN